MRPTHALSRVKLDARKIDHLINLGMRIFNNAGLYVPLSKMSKLTRDAARKWGYGVAERIIHEYFDSRQLADWESYKRALHGGDL